MADRSGQFLWHDRKRYLGLPLSFTRYAISEDRLFQSTGFLSIQDEEVLLYRVRDISMSRTFGQRMFGVGTVTVASSDQSQPTLRLVNIKDPASVKELLHNQVEENKIRRRVRFSEIAAYGDDAELEGEFDDEDFS